MTREQATRALRTLLDEHNLQDWHIRITTDISKPFLGRCEYRDKTIYLNGFHIDTHPDAEVTNCIRHEVAHALTPNHQHDDVWRAKAKELGCDNTMTCGMSLSLAAIDAIRSGANLEVTFDEQVIRTPHYKVTRLQEKCKVCGKVAREVSSKEITTKSGDVTKVIELECGHYIFKELPKATPFGSLVSIVDSPCTIPHVWNKTVCVNCGAYKPYDFQVEGMQFLERALAVGKGGAVFDEMGLGKTIQALGLLKFHPEYHPFLVLCPSSIMYQWAKAIESLLGENYFPQIITQGKSYVLPKMKCYVTSYDLLRKLDLTQFKHVKLVVLDEVQKIKNVDSTRTGMVRTLVKTIPSVIELSGTPWKNRGSEFYPCLNILDPIKFNSYEGFKNRWVDYYWDGNKQKEGGINNPARFKEHTKDLLIRRERTEVMKELPVVSRNRFYVQLDNATRQLYNEALSDFVKWWNQQVISGEEESFSVNQNIVAQLQTMRHVIGLGKVPSTVQQVLQFAEQTGRKLVVFTHHLDVAEVITEELRKQINDGYIVKRMSADLNPAERFQLQEEFNRTEKIVLIASQLASGEGLNLQTCSDCIMHERQWNPQNEEQCESRFIRIGQQSDHVDATYMHADNSVDTKFDGIIERKRAQFHSVMNKGEMPTWTNMGSIMKELAQSLADDFNSSSKRKK